MTAQLDSCNILNSKNINYKHVKVKVIRDFISRLHDLRTNVNSLTGT